MKKHVIGTLCAVALCAGAAEIDYPTLISHRGESIDAPENTIPAFKLAVDRGFGFECDVYLSKDNRVFTFHDGNLNRTTGGVNRKKCSEATWDELSKLDVGAWGKWKKSSYTGTRPALLEEVLELARDGRFIYVEVKPGPHIVPYIKEIFEKQNKANPSNVLFISFKTETCKALKAALPSYKVYWLTGAKRGLTPEKVIAQLKKTGSDGVDIQYSSSLVTKEFISKIREAGYELHVWTVNKTDVAAEAFSRGAMTLTTDRAKGIYEDWKKLQAGGTK